MKIETAEEFFAEIEKRRAQIEMSERDLSQRIGRSAGAYWWWKARGTKSGLETAFRLAKAVGVTVTVSSST